MSYAFVVALALSGVLLLAVGFVFLAVRGAGGWRKKLQEVLVPIGFQSCESREESAALANRLNMINSGHRGKRVVINLFKRQSPQGDFTIYVCDYHFGSASGRARGAQWMLVCLVSDALALPRVTINNRPGASGIAGRLFDAFEDGMVGGDLRRVKTGDDNVDKRHHLYVTDERGMEAARLTLPHLDKDGLCVDMMDDIIALSSVDMMADRVRQVLDPQKLLGQLHRATQICNALASAET